MTIITCFPWLKPCRLYACTKRDLVLKWQIRRTFMSSHVGGDSVVWNKDLVNEWIHQNWVKNMQNFVSRLFLLNISIKLYLLIGLPSSWQTFRVLLFSPMLCSFKNYELRDKCILWLKSTGDLRLSFLRCIFQSPQKGLVSAWERSVRFSCTCGTTRGDLRGVDGLKKLGGYASIRTWTLRNCARLFVRVRLMLW